MTDDTHGLTESEDPVLVRSFRGHTDAVSSIAFHTNMKQLISGGLDGNVMVWNFKPQLRALRFAGHKGAVHSVAFSPMRSLIASGSKDQTVRLWQTSADGRSTEIKSHAGTVRCVGFSPDGHHLISCSDDKSVKVHTTLYPIALPDTYYLSINFKGVFVDGRLAASCGDDKSIRVWDLRSKATVRRYDGHGGSINDVAFHPDGTLIAGGMTDSSIRVWDVRTNTLLQLYREHGGAITGLRFHPNGNFMLSASLDTTLKVWDVREGRLFYTVHGHEGSTLGVDFSPAGDFFASSSTDSQVMVWKTNFDRFLDDRILIPTATNHKRNDIPPTVVRETTKPSSSSPAYLQTHSQEPTPEERPGLDAVLDREGISNVNPDSPEAMTQTLQHLVGELNVMSQTMALLVQRLTLNEDKVRKLEEQRRPTPLTVPVDEANRLETVPCSSNDH